VGSLYSLKTLSVSIVCDDWCFRRAVSATLNTLDSDRARQDTDIVGSKLAPRQKIREDRGSAPRATITVRHSHAFAPEWFLPMRYRHVLSR
jgi:hypothetical protein